MARISLDPPQTLWYRLGARFSRRRYGVMLDPGAAIGHNMQVGRSYTIFRRLSLPVFSRHSSVSVPLSWTFLHLTFTFFGFLNGRNAMKSAWCTMKASVVRLTRSPSAAWAAMM